MQLPATRQTPWGPNRAEAVETDDTLPAGSDVVIIGAGANGILAAWHLADQGVSVTVLDKGEVACESSSRAFGWISGLMLDPSKMELSRQSIALWASLQAEIGEIGFRQNGLCYFADSTTELGHFETWRDQVRGSYDGVELLDSGGVAARFPGLRKRFPGAIVGHADSSLEPRIAVPRVARRAAEKGVRIIQGCAVRGIETSAGRVSAVITERGCIHTSAVLCATNIWSRLFAGNLGIDVPQLYAIMSMGETTPASDGPTGNGGQEHWAWRRQIDGGYSLGRLRGQRVPVTGDTIHLFSKFVKIMRMEAHNVRPSLGAPVRDLHRPKRWRLDEETPFERCRILDFPIDRRVPHSSIGLNVEHFPAFADAQIAEYWSGAVAITPDNVAIASAAESLPGFYVLSGCAYGLTWSTALGRMMAEIITGKPPSLDPRPYRLSRFSDGSPIIVRT